MNKYCILALAAASASSTDAYQGSVKTPLTMFNSAEYPLARCLDGTTAGYYAQPTSSEVDKHKWVVYLNGGGTFKNGIN